MIQDSSSIASSFGLFTSCSKRGCIAEWFHGEMPDVEARSMLEEAPPKSFIVYLDNVPRAVADSQKVRATIREAVGMYGFPPARSPDSKLQCNFKIVLFIIIDAAILCRTSNLGRSFESFLLIPRPLVLIFDFFASHLSGRRFVSFLLIPRPLVLIFDFFCFSSFTKSC